MLSENLHLLNARNEAFILTIFVLYIVERIKNKSLLVGKRLLVLKLFEQGN